MSLLLKSGAKVNTIDYYGYTPLFSAAETGNSQIVRLLLEHGAITSTRSKIGEYTFVMAAAKGHTRIVEMIIKQVVKYYISIRWINYSTILFRYPVSPRWSIKHPVYLPCAMPHNQVLRRMLELRNQLLLFIFFPLLYWLR